MPRPDDGCSNSWLMETPARPVVSITVIAYNSGQCLRDCLLSVRRSAGALSAELIVVDNASPDDSAHLVTREFPEAVLIRSPWNRGFAGGCNLAWPRVRGRYWLLLNPDVVVPPAGIEQLVTWFDHRPELGAASPQLIGEREELHAVGRRFPSAWRTLLELSRVHRVLPRRRWADNFLGGYWVRIGDDFEADWVPGAAMIVRRRAVENAGLLCERYFMYGEDIEWCWRMRQAGWRIGVAGGIRFRHEPGTSAIRTWGQTEWYYRMWHGWYGACRTIRGPVHVFVLLLLQSVALAVDVWRARRDTVRRRSARRDLAIHAVLLRDASRDMCHAVAEWTRRFGIGHAKSPRRRGSWRSGANAAPPAARRSAPPAPGPHG